MGDLTRSTMETHVKFRIGNPTNVDSLITDAVKMSYDSLVTSILLPENQGVASVVLTEGISTYIGPTDFVYPIFLRNVTDTVPLKQRSHQALDRKGSVSNGPPREYIWYGGDITFSPTPDDSSTVIQMRYMKRLPPLSATTSVSDLPREWDEVIIQGAFARMLSWMDQNDASLREEAKLDKMIASRLDRIREALRDSDEVAAPVLGPLTTWRAR